MWPVRLLSRDAQESPLTFKGSSYLCPRRGSALEGCTTTRSGGPGWVAYAWVLPERCPRAQAPRATLPRGGVAMTPDTELKGSTRLIRPGGRPQLFITSAEHSASALARA